MPAALTSQNTADTALHNGGLYENITPDSMQAEFETWCYDASRAVGDGNRADHLWLYTLCISAVLATSTATIRSSRHYK